MGSTISFSLQSSRLRAFKNTGFLSSVARYYYAFNKAGLLAPLSITFDFR